MTSIPREVFEKIARIVFDTLPINDREEYHQAYNEHLDEAFKLHGDKRDYELIMVIEYLAITAMEHGTMSVNPNKAYFWVWELFHEETK